MIVVFPDHTHFFIPIYFFKIQHKSGSLNKNGIVQEVLVNRLIKLAQEKSVVK